MAFVDMEGLAQHCIKTENKENGKPLTLQVISILPNNTMFVWVLEYQEFKTMRTVVGDNHGIEGKHSG